MQDLESTVYGLSSDDRVLDVILLIDGSSSIHPVDEWNIIKFSARHLLSRINLQRGRVAIVQFSRHVRVEHEFSNDLYSLQLTLNNMSQMRQDTNTRLGLQTCQDIFESATANAEKIIILLTDGDASDNPTDKALELQTQYDVKILGIGVGPNVSRERLEQVANLNYCFLIPSMEKLREIFARIGTYAYEKPEVKILRRFCDKLEVEISCSGEISEYKVELFNASADTADKYQPCQTIVPPNPSAAIVQTFITGLKCFSTVDFRVHGIMKNNKKTTALVYVKEKTLDEKRDSSMLKDPSLLQVQIDKLKNELKMWTPDNFLQEEIGLQEARVALLGRVGEGKSSYINTILSCFNGIFQQVAKAMAHTKSVTSKLTEYPLKDTNLVLMDSYGWENNNYSLEEQKLICDGVLSDGYKEGESTTEWVLNGNHSSGKPSFNQALHGVIIVCDADAVTNKTFMNRLKEFEVNWRGFDRSLIVLLTKCDMADPELIDHPESIYDSEIVEKRINTLSKLTGIEKGDIYPCVNRIGLNVSNPAVREYLALKALHSCISSAVAGTYENERRKILIEKKKKEYPRSPVKDLALIASSTNTNVESSPPRSPQITSPVIPQTPPSDPTGEEEFTLMIALQDGDYIDVELADRTLQGLKEAIVGVQEFGLTNASIIDGVYVIKEVDGKKCKVLLRTDKDVARLKKDAIVCFKKM